MRPGHVLPAVRTPGGVLERRGHTETAVDLARARRAAAGRGDLRGARRRRLAGAAPRTSRSSPSDHRIAMVSVEQVVQYRLDNAAATRSRTVATLLL